MLLRLPILLLVLVDQVTQVVGQPSVRLHLLVVDLVTAALRLTRAALVALVVAADLVGRVGLATRQTHPRRKAAMEAMARTLRQTTAVVVAAARLQQAVLQLARLAVMAATARLRLLAAVL